MMEETGEPRAKLLYLESLRGIAAVVVVFSHFAAAFFPAAVVNPAAALHNPIEPWFHNTPLGILLAGNFAVCLFFAMSGFVLVRPFYQSRRQDILMNAAVRRYLRLMPPVAVSVLAAYLLLKLGWFSNQAQVSVTGSIWLHQLWSFSPAWKDAAYQAFIGAFGSLDVNYNPLLWTMRTEFLGSLLIFALAALTHGIEKRWLIYIILVLVFSRSYFLGFIGGMILADYMTMPNHAKNALSRLKTPALAGLMFAGLILGAYPSDLRADVSWYQGFTLPFFSPVELMSFWHTLGALMVLISVLYWPAVRRALSHRWLVGLGKQSFTLYLSHMIILCTLGTYLFGLFHTRFGYHVSFIGTFAITLVVMFGVSWIFMRLVDIPSVKVAKSFGRWLMKKPMSPATPAADPSPAPAPPVSVPTPVIVPDYRPARVRDGIFAHAAKSLGGFSEAQASPRTLVRRYQYHQDPPSES